jgi:hypothetical protein
MLNKKHRTGGNKVGRPDPDTPQNVISTTCIMLGPPLHRDEEAPEAVLYAPRSQNELANTPSRGDWAVCAPAEQDWLARVVTSGVNTYSNALAVFTNMAGVPKGTRIRFAGLVGNAGMGKQGDKSADNFGQVYSAGALSGRNTGPEYIPPLSPVYLSPYPYIRKDAKTGRSYPGYTDPGWDAVNCDKYQPAVHALRDADVMAFFHSVESTLKEEAKNDNCIRRAATIISDLGIHPHVPVHKYAVHFLYQARVDELITQLQTVGMGAGRQAVVDQLVKAMVLTIAENKKYWRETAKEQKEITDALGGPKWDTRKDEATMMQDPKSNATNEQLLSAYVELMRASMEIFKCQFAEQANFIRSLVFGKSRYGSPSEGQLDVMCGYRL